MSSVSPVLEPRTVAGRARSRWIQVGSHIDARYGGITASVPRLSAATESEGFFESPIAGFCDADEKPAGSAPVTRFPRGRVRWLTESGLRSGLRALIEPADGLHIHGIWEEHCAEAIRVARKTRKPYIVSAHGMLEQWAVKSKWLKKAAYSMLVERPNLSHANCLRALTVAEVDDYRRFGLRNPIAVIPNGVDSAPAVDDARFFEAFPQLAGKRLVLFLSRLIHKKGLDLLCRAWPGVAAQFPEAHLVIAGPDDGARPEIERLVRELGVERSVTLPGMLSGETKWSALAAAEVFVLPSRSEGFSMAILEALAAGVPVILTRQCHFPEVAAAGCGWEIEPDAGQLRNAVETSLQLPEAEKRRMGQNGRALTARRYSWPVIGRQMGQVYDWLLGAPKPESVEIF